MLNFDHVGAVVCQYLRTEGALIKSVIYYWPRPIEYGKWVGLQLRLASSRECGCPVEDPVSPELSSIAAGGRMRHFCAACTGLFY